MQLPRKMSVNVMASIGCKLGNRQDGSGKHPNDIKLACDDNKDKLYEPKHRQKVVRVLTVVAYVVSVSLAAIILSLYYTFIWDPKDRPLYAIRQNSLNSTSKVECINLTIPLIVNYTARKANDSPVTRIPVVDNATTDETLDQRVNDYTTISNRSIDVEIPPDLPDNSTDLERKSLILQPESSLNEDERARSREKRLMQDTSDFDFA